MALLEITMQTSRKGLTAIVTVMALITLSSVIMATPAAAKKFTQIGEDMGKCMQKAMGSDAGTVSPPPKPAPHAYAVVSTGASAAVTLAASTVSADAANDTTGGSQKKDKMCACKDSACAQ